VKFNTDFKQMSVDDLRALAAKGEDSARQFKADITNAESLAAEMAAAMIGKASGKCRDNVGKKRFL
jgi:hypothetical protein